MHPRFNMSRKGEIPTTTTTQRFPTTSTPNKNAHLKQPIVPQIICNNDIVDSCHDKLDLRRVRRACKVDKDLLGLRLIEGLELVGPVLTSRVIVVPSYSFYCR